MININSLQGLSSLKNSSSHAKSENSQSAQTSLASNKPIDELSFSHRSAVSMRVVYQAVSSNLPSSFQLTQPEAETNVEENAPLFDFEKVAQEVLAFVSKGINAAKHRGASNDELESMFEQAKVGVNQGIDEAIEELDKLSILDDDIKQGIDKSKALIEQGLDELHSNFFPSAELINESSSKQVSLNNLSSVNSENFASRSRSSELNIVTADGDKVSISFSQLQQYANVQQLDQINDSGQVNQNYHSSTSSINEHNFSYSIEGQLDDSELKAIDELINNVSKLEKEFFEGDIEKAYQQALQLGFNDKELASFSMELQQSQTSYVSQQYRGIADFDNKPAEVNTDIKPLFNFIEQLDELRNQVDKLFDNNVATFDNLFKAVFEAEFGDNNQQLAQLMQFIDKF